MKVLKQCPQCGKIYSGPSALSRSDNSTEICPACGMAEALKAMDAVKADAARDQGDPVDTAAEADSWYVKMEDLVIKANGSEMMPEVGKLYAEAVKDFTTRLNAASQNPPMLRGDLIFLYEALCLLKNATENSSAIKTSDCWISFGQHSSSRSPRSARKAGSFRIIQRSSSIPASCRSSKTRALRSTSVDMKARTLRILWRMPALTGISTRRRSST